jgi:phosphate starvation-inducible protein PhoH and related proteins
MSKNKRLQKQKLTQNSSNTAPDVKDKSVLVHQANKLERPVMIRQRPDLTNKQKEFLKLALDNQTKVIFLSGPSGSSKSFLATLASLELLNLKKVSDLIYIRSIVESSDNKMGYLPGDAAEKLSPYLEPLMEKLDELLVKADINMLMKENRIEGKPTGYLRGLSWNAKAIIMDEAQNSTFKELTTLLTRVGQFSKLFICGDPMQSDINGKSGFEKMCNIFNDEESKSKGIHVFYLTEADIVRSEIVRYIVKKLELYNKKP